MIDIKILHICSYYYGTKLYKNLMERFKEKNVDFKVFAPCSYDYNYNGNEEYLISEKCFNKIDRLCFHYKYNKVYNKLIDTVNVKEYDLLHAHSLFSNGYIAYKIYEKYKIPYVVAVRNTDINVFFKYCIQLRKLGQRILENASKIIFISNAYKEKLLEKCVPNNMKKNIEEKCVVIPNGIDDYFLLNCEKQPKKIENNTLNLVYTGRADKNKNLITTIKCCDTYLKGKYNIKLNVIGKITYKKYKRIFNNYDFINYLGPKNKEEIVEIYKNMNIFVMPSKHETFGLTYVEAMTQGLPVIYTKNEGFDKFFEDGLVGYPIKYNDYSQMAEKIELIINNYQIMSRNCIRESKRFNWNDISQEYINLYNNL